jgi:NADH:ubiquinone oxidoreductase subunit 6 (subunit J)
MGNFFHGVFQTFFLIGYIILFIVTILILRPFRYHKRRQKSTIFLKICYLLYLASFLAFTYLLLFGRKEITESEQPYETLFNIHFLFFLTSTIVPNVGIMIRRKIKKNRVEFNILASIIILLYFFYLSYLCFSHKWALM